jgi:frataxin-like iron-binding protein CyaY
MMMPPSGDETLYRLIPAIYRLRDSAEGEPLRALLAIFQREHQLLQSDIDQLYENWFIETCSAWVVPYIGDLLHVKDLYAESSRTYGQRERRGYVANTIAYRRRKGTTAILEQLTQDVTGWRARAVEFGRLVGTTQNLNHPRPTSTTLSLRDDTLGEIGTPFHEQAHYSAEVRSLRQGGRYNTSSLGLFVWRLQSYPLTRVQARAVSGAETYRTCHNYVFNPLGQDGIPLFNRPQTKTDIVRLAREINVPARLRRSALAAELLGCWDAQARAGSAAAQHHPGIDAGLQIFLNGQSTPVPPYQIKVQSLGDDSPGTRNVDLAPWRSETQIRWNEGEDASTPPIKVVAVDPELGRLAFRGAPPEKVEVSYCYGFSDDIGGGPYPRLDDPIHEVNDLKQPLSPWHWPVQRQRSGESNPLATAIEEWNRTVLVRHGLRLGTHTGIAVVEIPPVQVVKLKETHNHAVAPAFRPGVIKGLRIRRGLCPTEVVVSSGLAMDARGRPLMIPCDRNMGLAGQSGVLVLHHNPETDQDSGQLALLTDHQLAACPGGTFIPLARISCNGQGHIHRIESLNSTPTFRAGIVEGMDVCSRAGTLESWIAAGTVVDAAGNCLILTENHPLALWSHQGQQRAVIIIPSGREDHRVQLVPESELLELRAPHIVLALLEIPSVEAKQDEQAKDMLAVRPLGHWIEVGPGEVHSPSGESLRLSHPQRFNLSRMAGRSILIFLSSLPDQGWPLSGESNAAVAGDAHLGWIPVEQPHPGEPHDLSRDLGLESVDCGWIVIGDSASYEGDLEINLPPHSHLQILAADGCRPHIRNGLNVQSRSQVVSEQEQRQDQRQLAPSQLRLNGLLVEGPLTIRPGDLGRLTIEHCTLVPSSGGLQVEAIPEGEGPHTDGLSLQAFLIISLMLTWQVISRDLGLSNSAPPLSMGQLLQSLWRQLLAGVAPGAGAPCPKGGHHHLAVHLERTISGPLLLADSVSQLHINNSIIDHGGLSEFDTLGISAPGTSLEMAATTVFGRTTAAYLKASDCIFTDPVTVSRHQSGCIRFSYLPVTSDTPRRYQCQPDLALRLVLDQIPGGVTALSRHDCPADRLGEHSATLFCATNGDGLFQREGAFPGSSAKPWLNITANLSARDITALASVSWDQPLQEGSTNRRTALMVGTATGKIFQRETNIPFTEANTESATTDLWRQVTLPELHGAVTGLYPEKQVKGTGEIRLTASQNDSADIVGVGTRFSAELQSRDVVVVGGRPWRIEQLGRSSGNVKILSKRRTVTQLGATLAARINLNDTITIETTRVTAGRPQSVSQTRRIMAINHTASPPTLHLDAPFKSDITDAIPFTINIDTELTVKAMTPATGGTDADAVGLLPFTYHRLWATTDGNGLLRASIDGQNWQAFNAGLGDLRLKALVRGPREQLWLGSPSSGIHRLERTVADDRWIPLSRGLPMCQVNILIRAADSLLLAGTTQGMYRFDDDHGEWVKVAGGLPEQLDIRAIASAAPIHRGLMFAGTHHGQLFRSSDGGQHWQPIALDLGGTAITAIVVEAQSEHVDVWLGAADGSIRHSGDGRFEDRTMQWRTIHHGRQRLAKKFQVVNQIQPSFTSNTYGQPGYGQLSEHCPAVIRRGAEDSSEMGAFHSLKQPQRESNLRDTLNEYVRFGMTADITYVS